jgi:hypothetical protein
VANALKTGAQREIAATPRPTVDYGVKTNLIQPDEEVQDVPFSRHAHGAWRQSRGDP